MKPIQRVKPVLMVCCLGASVALPGLAFAKGPCPPIVRELPLKLERKDGLGGGPLVSYPQRGSNGPRYDTAITTMGMFWAEARLTAIDFKNVVSLHPNNTIILQSYSDPDGNIFEENFLIGERSGKTIHFDLKKPIILPAKGIEVSIIHDETVDNSYTLSYRGVVLHLDVSKWFCKIPL
jgi:hypothetical protein